MRRFKESRRGGEEFARWERLAQERRAPELFERLMEAHYDPAYARSIGKNYPQIRRLMPPAGTLERSQCYRWTSYIITELDAPPWTIAKHRFALPPERRVPAVIETAGWEFRTAAKVLAMGIDDRDYPVGDCLTVADILAGHTLSWAKSARLSLGSEQLDRYLERLFSRDAVTRARARTQAAPVVVPAER